MIRYKKCTFRSISDQEDIFEQFLKEDKFSPECLSTRNSQQPHAMDNKIAFADSFIPNTGQVDELLRQGPQIFPIKNKSKYQNSQITNFMFDQDKNPKQETFLLSFDLMDRESGILRDALKITDGMTGRQFMFKIQGYIHGQTVFTDSLHYLLKGGKLMKCSLETMNAYRLMCNKVSRIQVPYQKEGDGTNKTEILEDQRGHLFELPIYNQKGKKLNLKSLLMNG